jgi:hypothetical protein
MTPSEQDPYGSGDRSTEYDQRKKASPGQTRSAWCVVIAAAVVILFVLWLFVWSPSSPPP